MVYKEKARSAAISFSLVFSVLDTCLRANASGAAQENGESCCMKGPDGSIPPDSGTRVGVGTAKGEKRQHLSVTAWQMANYHFFSASLSPTRTKPRSCRLCCLHHFPPLLHLWYANGKTERFCAAEKDLWAYSLGQQLQLLCRGAACCARSLVPRNIPLHVLPKNNNNNKKELTIWLSRCPETYLKKLWHDILPLVTLWTSKQQASLGSPVQIPAPLCAIQEMMVSSLPQSSSRLSEAEVVQKYFSVYTDALHSWEQK